MTLKLSLDHFFQDCPKEAKEGGFSALLCELLVCSTGWQRVKVADTFVSA